MNILITGGSGFIGKNLQELLHGKYRVFAPHHNELDLLDLNSLLSYIHNNHIDFIIHGAIHVPMFNGAENEFYNDMKMFLNIEKISKKVSKVLYFGSGAEYDKRYHIRNVSEDDFGRSIPISEYGLAKYTMNKIARISDNIYNLRLFGIFGKYELWQIKFLSNICCKAIYELPITIRKNCKFNYLLVDDLGSIVEWFINNKPSFHDYNLCHDEAYDLFDFAKMVRQISGKELDIQLLSEERNMDYTARNARLKTELLFWKPTPIYEALTRLYYYYSKNKNIIDYSILKDSR